MFGFLLLAFIVVSPIEIFLITQVAGQLSWPTTLALVIGISMAGAWLVKREGLGVINRIQSAFQGGKIPRDELADGAMIFFASALMLTPGFLTDALGLALLIPPIRALLRPFVVNFFKKRVQLKAQSFGVGAAGATFGSGFPGRPGFGRDVYDVPGRPSSNEADITDITPEPDELTDPNA